MNMDELEGALQLINNSLLSEREFEYLFHVCIMSTYSCLNNPRNNIGDF